MPVSSSPWTGFHPSQDTQTPFMHTLTQSPVDRKIQTPHRKAPTGSQTGNLLTVEQQCYSLSRRGNSRSSFVKAAVMRGSFVTALEDTYKVVENLQTECPQSMINLLSCSCYEIPSWQTKRGFAHIKKTQNYLSIG